MNCSFYLKELSAASTYYLLHSLADISWLALLVVQHKLQLTLPKSTHTICSCSLHACVCVCKCVLWRYSPCNFIVPEIASYFKTARQKYKNTKFAGQTTFLPVVLAHTHTRSHRSVNSANDDINTCHCEKWRGYKGVESYSKTSCGDHAAYE